MIAESLISLAPMTYAYLKDALNRGKMYQEARQFEHADAAESDGYYDLPEEDEPEHEPPERLVPTRWVTTGLAASGILGVVLVWIVFGSDGIHPWATAIGLVLASILSLIGVRALGQTDINPVSFSRSHVLADIRFPASARSASCSSQYCSLAMSSRTSLQAVSLRLVRSRRAT